jgi:uncharacterized membrane protein
MWQDLVITISTLLLGYALIPQVVHGFKKRKGTVTIQTSLITTLGLYTIAICLLTLNLQFSAIMNFITGTLWAVLLIQRIAYK